MLILFVCIFLLVSGYTSDKKRAADEYVGICKLLKHIRDSISAGGRTLPEIICGFSCEELEGSDILARLGGAGLSKSGEGSVKCRNTNEAGACDLMGNWRVALRECRTYIEEADKSALFDYFCGFGRGNADEELKLVGEILSIFDKRRIDVCARAEKDIKVAWLLFAVGAAGVLILML